MTTRPVAIIGLDSMDPGLVSQWITAGELPNLGKLMAQSACGQVTNPPWLDPHGG